MTLDSHPCQNYRLLEPCECVDLCDLGEVPPLYTALEPEIQPKPCPIQRPDVDTPYKELRQRALERLLDKLSGTQLLGSHYAERYLWDQYRRGCRPNTMRSSCTAIKLFLSFITGAGKPPTLNKSPEKTFTPFLSRSRTVV